MCVDINGAPKLQRKYVETLSCGSRAVVARKKYPGFILFKEDVE